MGIVYLLHFEKKYYHAQHYIGYSKKGDKRLSRHKSGNGSKLLKAVNSAGIDYFPVRVWENVDRKFERKLHKRKNSKLLCPLCNRK